MSVRWKASDLQLGPNGRLTAKPHTMVSQSPPGTRERFDGIVMGVDPSLRGTGVAVIRNCAGQAKLLFSTTLKTKASPVQALAQIAQSIDGICKQYKPDIAAVEETIYVQNNCTAITLGSARGAALASLTLNQVGYAGFAPTRIKQSVVGHGHASKAQVIAMTRTLLKLADPLPPDEADAAAAALCYIFTY